MTNRVFTLSHTARLLPYSLIYRLVSPRDLVKSHLMFAVREEVEVLKEKIAELMDRINQLEMENAVLKANATQETLAQLSSSLQPPTSNAP
ncbi:hypothetical protein J6590_018640 [Homalodisca vitripennis]|nr:hypothetical protein J6590_018640 [Homalodisca vitripennis]